jgi:hypothetical protein
MSFIVSPTPAETPPNASVSAGDFWGSIDMNNARDVIRIGSATIPDARLRAALRAAIITVTSELEAWRLTQQSAGYQSLSSVPCDTIDAISIKVLLFQRAVLAHTCADLIETHRDLTASTEGASRAEDFIPTAEEHRRNATYAIRDIVGKRRTKVSLI